MGYFFFKFRWGAPMVLLIEIALNQYNVYINLRCKMMATFIAFC